MSTDDHLPRSQEDHDPHETSEWLDSLEYVLETHGLDRATYLFERLRDLTTSAGRMCSVKTEIHTHDLALKDQQTSNTPCSTE